MPVRDTDPFIGFNFMLDMGGKCVGLFTECSGLGSETEIVEHKVVDQKGKDFVQKIPGRLKYNDITLKRGITKTIDAWNWRAEVEKGDMKTARINGTITFLDREGTPGARWNLTNAWPSKITGPAAKSDANDIGVEEIVIVAEKVERVSA